MTVTVYRLGKLRYRDQLFAGLGGLHADGHWTHRGRPVVYTLESIALAVLVYTVHYRRRGWVPPSVLGRIPIPDDMPIEAVAQRNLASNWSDPDPPPTRREIGEQWLRRGATAVFKMPSATVCEEWNYLLNPLHADFKALAFGGRQRYELDRRLARTRRGR